MSEKTSVGVWVAIGLSIIVALIISLSRSLNIGSFFIVYALFFIVLYIIYWVITKVYPKSQNWGVNSWAIALGGSFFIAAVGMAFIYGFAGSGSNINQITTPQPTPVVFNVLSLFTPQPTPQGIPFPDITPQGISFPDITPTVQWTLPSIEEAKQEAEDKKANSISQAIDYLNPTVHNFALQQVQRSSSGAYTIAQICDVWQSINRQWTYVSDPPNFDYWTSASDSINNGLKGNCADYATLNAAVIESIGGAARVVTACAPGGSPCHAYAEVYLDNTQSELQAAANEICSRYHCNTIHSHPYLDSKGNTEHWLNLDWQANYPGGPFFQDDGTIHIFYPNGYHFTSTG
jgi:hypothetical protein